MNFKSILLLIAIFSLSIIACQQPKQETENNTTTVDTVTVKEQPTAPVAKETNRTYNDVARYVAGLKQEEGSQLGVSDSTPAFKEYESKTNNSWARFNDNKLKKMSKWIDSELKETHENTQTVFYPFSGPDFLNMNTFFPNAKKYIMIGLEPIGLVPDVKKIPKDSLRNYFGAVQQSLFSILNLSFFKTIDMAEDFKSQQLDGIIVDLFVFIVRTGNKIVDVRPIEINEQGGVIDGSYISAGKVDKNKVYGIEITFAKEGTTDQQTLYYFSADLWDRSLQANYGFLQFLKDQGGFTTYLKSASYLMHKDYFSIVRKIILSQSQYVLQDDSGIPYRFYTPENWEVKLYGSYSKPINLFKDWYQEDLKTAYKDSSRSVKPLNFGIGYNFQVSQSNLLLAKRKSK